MKISSMMAVIIFLAISASAASGARSPSPADARLYFIAPQDGELVNGEFKVSFGLRGMGVAPAGIDATNTGHHHLLIDVDSLPPMDQLLPKSQQVRHFGGGQTETTLSLKPGKHTLQLLLGNHSHIPHNPPVVSQKITITVIQEP